MKRRINIQIHDYDSCGRYLIVEDRKVTPEYVHELKEKARRSVNVNWGKLPPEATHIVYYAELLDSQDEVCFAAIYMHGEAYDEAEFDRIFHQPNIGYVGAIHKRVPMGIV